MIDMSKVTRSRHYGYWTESGGKNIKAFFDSFAQRNHLGDPCNPNTWYRANTHTLKNEVCDTNQLYTCILRAIKDVA
jgi:hypothetical protein